MSGCMGAIEGYTAGDVSMLCCALKKSLCEQTYGRQGGKVAGVVVGG